MDKKKKKKKRRIPRMKKKSVSTAACWWPIKDGRHETQTILMSQTRKRSEFCVAPLFCIIHDLLHMFICRKHFSRYCTGVNKATSKSRCAVWCVSWPLPYIRYTLFSMIQELTPKNKVQFWVVGVWDLIFNFFFFFYRHAPDCWDSTLTRFPWSVIFLSFFFFVVSF